MPRSCLWFVVGLLLTSLFGQQAARQTRQQGAWPVGEVVHGTYRNSTFGFSCKIPFGWVDRTEEMRADDAPQPGDSVKPNGPVKSLVLLAVFERPPEASGSTINSAIVIAAEKTSQYSELKSAADYFGPITELATEKGFTVVNEPYEFSVGAKQLVRGDFSKPRGSLTMVQSSLVTIEKGYAVSFTFIGGTEDEVSSLIANLSFPPKKPSGTAHK
ncbi:MAG TPA: hypothetical protein VLW84_12105 [Terriglobales bacterium]|nr:hypothetical protein [Terriglobales bacterium]